MKKVDDKIILADLEKLRKRLDIIDLIEFKSGRGNTSLESAVPLARALHADITSLGKELAEAANTAEQSQWATTPDQLHQQFGQIITDIKDLLRRIDHDIPLLHMAITASGRILNIGNTSEDNNPVLLLKRDVSATFTASMWKDAMRFSRRPEATSLTGQNEQEDVDRQIREESLCVDEAKCLDGRINKDGAEEPHRSWSFPAHLDPEWLAFEIFADDNDEGEGSSDTSSIHEEYGVSPSISYEMHDKSRIARNFSSVDSKLLQQLQSISLGSSATSTPPQPMTQQSDLNVRTFVSRSPFGAITTSLSLMEMLIRLTSLQGFQQASHLSIDDHILTFFLEETSTTGLDCEERLKARDEAKRRIGFDPYIDTPTKS
ncbi:hypothetical protein ACHAQH_005588 [Verticillium albo-atrum]